MLEMNTNMLLVPKANCTYWIWYDSSHGYCSDRTTIICKYRSSLQMYRWWTMALAIRFCFSKL